MNLPTNPKFGENLPPEEPKPQKKPTTAATWASLVFIMVVVGALLAPLVIWLWRAALGLL